MNKKVLMVIGWLVFLAIMLIMLVKLSETDSANKAGTDDKLNIEFITTKDDADAILIWQGECAMMIDTGEEKDSSHILEELSNKGINRLEYMILTHNDKDHVGSAKTILETLEVSKVIMAPYATNTERTEELLKVIDEKNISLVYPTHNSKLDFGTTNLVVYPPYKTYYEDENNYSLAVLLQHDSVSCLFTGDAKKKRDEELLMNNWPKIDLYKVPYHGRACSKSDDLFLTLLPEYAVVTSDSADDKIVDASKKSRTVLLYTRDGDILFESDGKTIERK